MTTPDKMSNTSETGEISQPLSLPEKRKADGIEDGANKRRQPGDVKSDPVITPTFGFEIGEGPGSSQPPEKKLDETGEGAPKSRPLTEEQHRDVVAPASGSQIDEGYPQLPPAGTQKLPASEIAPASGTELGEGCPPLPPPGTHASFKIGGKVYVRGKMSFDELKEFQGKVGISLKEFAKLEIFQSPPPPCPFCKGCR